MIDLSEYKSGYLRISDGAAVLVRRVDGCTYMVWDMEKQEKQKFNRRNFYANFKGTEKRGKTWKRSNDILFQRGA